MESASVHMVLTDPPYFLDGLDDGWSKGKIPASVDGSVGGLPIGMKFDPKQGKALQEFLTPVFAETLRILKPGGFMLVFSAPRLYHRMAIAAEDSGFEIRDQYAWQFRARAQFKAFTLDHFVRRDSDLSEREKSAVIAALGGRKTPQLRPQFEAILCAQKPRDGTFLNNWMEHGTGLIDAGQTLAGKVPVTVMPVEKDKKRGGTFDAEARPVVRASDSAIHDGGPNRSRSLCRERNKLHRRVQGRPEQHRHRRQSGIHRDRPATAGGRTVSLPPLEKRHGHRGVAHLRVAVLKVLYAAKKAGECIGAATIGRRAGIFREPGYAVKQGNDYIVTGVLNSLVKDGLFDKCIQANGRNGGELTNQAFVQRDQEVAEVPDWEGDRRIIEAYRLKQWGFCPGCLAVLPERPDVDHIRARAKGGDDTAENKQLLCPNCNRRRGANPFEEFVAGRLADGNKWTDYDPDG